MTRLEGILNSQSARGDSKEGLHGIRYIEEFQVKLGRNLEVNEKHLLENVSWNIQDEPSEAQKFVEGAQPKVNLSEKLFHGPIFLELESRYGKRHYQVPVFGGTTYDVFAVIYKFYQMYEAKHKMGRMWFEGLKYVSSGVWYLKLGS